MSKQFQLYLTPSDAVALVEELRVRFGARVLSEKSSTSDPVEMESGNNIVRCAAAGVRCPMLKF